MADDPTAAPVPARRRMSLTLKHTLEFGPVVVFFFTLLASDIFTATAVLMGLMTLAAGTAWAIEGRVSTLILLGTVAALGFGSLTLLLHDETFIKIRPSIWFSLLSVLLVGGLAFGRLFLRSLFEYAFRIDDSGWRKLTWRMAGFFLLLALANHLMWTNFSAETWAAYKLFAVPVLMMAFMLAQTPLLMRHQLPEDAPPADD